MEWDRSHWASLACVGTVGDLNILLPPLHHSQHDTKPVRKYNQHNNNNNNNLFPFDEAFVTAFHNVRDAFTCLSNLVKMEVSREA